MIDDVLYIIGNGFDLHHEVASSYSSFRLWLKKNDYALFNLPEFKQTMQQCRIHC